MQVEKILAKNNNGVTVTLIEHSKLVSELAVRLAMVHGENGIKFDDIKLAGLLHDIGKSTKHFQNLLNGKKRVGESKFLHNEIGYAFLKMYTTFNDYVCEAVYWHHGIYNNMSANTIHEILSSIKEEDITIMKEYIKYIGYESSLCVKNNGTKSTPTFYSDDTDVNRDNSFIRKHVVSADRIISKYYSENVNYEDVIKNYLNKSAKFEYKDPHNNERYRTQKEIVDSIAENQTTFINAPAGFGKTLVGLLWSFKSDKKLIWVCPRNFIAEGVYISILKELEGLGVNPSVELYWGGETKASSPNSKGGFSSDIIVTNIDNYLKPSVDSNNMDKLYLIHNSDVIFDEYHEFTNETAMNACFVNLMSVRQQLCKVNTLLLSATPNDTEILWETVSRKTPILPEKRKHYKAAHDKIYNIKVVDDLDIKTIPEKDCLFITNSIQDSQKVCMFKPFSTLLHSRFEEKHKNALFVKLFKNFGKDADEDADKGSVVSAPITQASLDISFQKLYESIMSPNATLQRFGRCNRHGKNEIGEVFLFRNNNQSDNKVKSIVYDTELSKKWYKFCKENFSDKKLILDEIYLLYNQFYKENEKEIHNYLITTHDRSLKRLREIYPIKYDGGGKSDIITAGGNKLRATEGEEIFITVKKSDNSGEWSGPIPYKIRMGYEKEFDEPSSGFERKMEQTVKGSLKKDERFDYSEFLNKIKDKEKFNKINMLRNMARKSNTPYPVFNMVYDDKILGLINNELFQRIK